MRKSVTDVTAHGMPANPPPAQVATGAGALLSRELTGWLTLLSACVRAYVCTLTWDAAGGSGLCLSGLEGPHCQTA